jgi:DNA-binding Lrp family transcriptional regulator
VVAAEPFVIELLRYADAAGGAPAGTSELVHAAHAARESTAEQPYPGAPLSVPLCLEVPRGRIDCWITDAREIARLKGIPDSQRLFLLSFEAPEALVQRGQRARVALKVRQDHHALVLVSVSLEPGRNDEYIDYVIETIGDAQRGSRLESEITLYAAAKIYGEYDFFFRVSCIDDESLRRFLEALQDDRFGVDAIEVRSTISERFYVSPHYPRILEHFQGRPHELVLTWFTRAQGSDPFLRLVYRMEEERPDGVRPVEILEAGEVIHHRPVYAIFACENLAAYAGFFDEFGLSPTATRSHIGQVTREGDLRLRYGLMSGVWVPSRRRVRAEGRRPRK